MEKKNNQTVRELPPEPRKINHRPWDILIRSTVERRIQKAKDKLEKAAQLIKEAVDEMDKAKNLLH